MAQKFLSDIHPTAGLKDSSGDLGSDGQVLSSTGSNTNWVNPTVGTTVIYKDAFTATNNQTAFTLANTVDSEDKTQVYIDGAYQSKGGYTVSGTTLTFDTGLVTSSAVEVMTFSTATANNAASAVKIDTFTGDGSDLTFVLDEAVVDEKVTQVYINGVYQNKSTYSIAADLVTLTFGSGNAPPNLTAIEVISFKTITSTDGTLTATTFLGDLNGTINTATTATTQSAGNNTTKIATTAFVTTASNAKVADAINNGTTGIAPSQNAVFDALALKSNIAGPTFTDTPAAPTASAGTNTTQLATTAFVTTGIANIVDSSPGALNTLNELAAALGDDANFSTTVTNSIATKLPLAGGTLTGDVTFTGASYNAVWDTSANLLQFADNAAIRIGTGNDVDIYHSSNVTYIKTQTDQPVSFIDAGGADMLKLTPNGAVNLYHNGTLALSTGSGGNATFAGKVGMNVAPASTRTLLVKGQGTSSSTAPFQVNDGNNADILVIKDDKTATFSGDARFLGDLYPIKNNGFIYFGSNSTARIQHISSSNSLAINTNGGNVGIGTSTLNNSSRLTLLESAGNGQTLEIIGANSGAGGSQPGIKFTGSSGQNIGGIFADTSSDNVRIQTGGTDRLTIASNGLITLDSSIILDNNEGIFWEATNGTNEGIVSNGSDLLFYTQGANRLTISSGGNADFSEYIRAKGSTAAPTSGVGLELAYNSTSNRGQIGVYDRSNSLYKQVYFYGSDYLFDTGGTPRLTISSGGEVKIGTGGSSANGLTIRKGGNHLFLQNQSNTGTYWNFDIDTNNRLYIITQATAQGVFINDGDTAFTGYSDENLKENIKPLENVLNKILDYKCVEFNFKSDKSKDKKIGFIAQDWDNDYPQITSKGKDDYLGMKYTETIPVLLKAIQEQQTIIEDLKLRIETLEG